MTDTHNHNHQPPPPPPPPPAAQPTVQYVATEPGKGLAVAALVCGITGSVFGLIPLTGLIAVALGLTGLVLGGIALNRRTRAKLHRTLAIWGVALSALALGFGIWGMVIVNDTVNDIDREFQELDDESYVPPSQQEIQQASDEELQELWWEAPGGSAAERQIEAEMDARAG